MKYLSHLVFAWLALCASFPALAVSPASIQAVYDVYKDSIKVGKIEESYIRDGDRYTLTSTTTPVGLLALFKPEKVFVRSSGMVGMSGLQPLLFSHRRENDTSKDSNAELDWKGGRITLIHQSQRETVALPQGTQDRLSAMYQFMFLPLKGGALDFPMTNGHKLDNYHYAVGRGPSLDTPAGKFSTLYLDSQPKAGERRTEIWLARQRHYLPCKMVVTEANGDRLIQVLSEISVKP
ncbi:MAG TPA: DUF3108 domain-containing protein [Gallionella sp.]|nr:DUF3108 domain-containing protein [Gallionella sp.]